jgi:hypothetical protein
VRCASANISARSSAFTGNALSEVTVGRLILHLGSPSAVVVLGPHAELAVAPRAIDEDFDIGAVAGLRHVELGHGRTGTVAADGGREALDEALAKRSLECLGAYGRDATRRCFQVLEPDADVPGTKSVGRQASIAHAPTVVGCPCAAHWCRHGRRVRRYSCLSSGSRRATWLALL